MARRKKEVGTNGRQDHEQPMEAEAVAGPMAIPPDAIERLDALGAEFAPTSPATPDFESRLAKLEAELSESNKIIRQQASAIAIGVENAEQLRKSRERVLKLEARADEAKKVAGEAKKAHEAAVKEHFALEKELDSGQARLPFPVEAEALPASAPTQPVAEAVTDSPTEDESWRGDDVRNLDIPASLWDKLHGAGILTIGHLSDYLKPNAAGFCKRLTDIPGIGNAKAEAIEEALMGFWSSRAMDADPGPDLDVDATLQAGCEAVEAERAEEFEASLAAVLANPGGNGEWEDSEPGSVAHPDDDDEDSADLGI